VSPAAGAPPAANHDAPNQRVAQRWRVREPAPPTAVLRLSTALRVHPQLAAVLWARGLRDDVAEHLDPALVPTAIPDLPAAAERLIDAIERGRRIRIHGDYDADGICGTAVLTLGLRALGAKVTPFIPHRIRDGYGIHPDRVAEHAAATDLLVTVDCGITNLAEIAALQAAGVEVIVSDHHTPGERQPDALVVHPKRSPLAGRGLPELTGAGVAYHLLWAVHRRLGLPDPVEFADLATIGTIADVAPLLGENRALVRLGLERLADSAWPGVRATLALARLRQAPTARDVAFGLAPRLNAAGRLGEADLALELLSVADQKRALAIATRLDDHNRERRRIQDAMLESALPKVDPEAPAIVIADDAWHPGVMGLVASALVERYYRPVFIVADGKGSVRSTPGISAVAGLAAASEHLRRWGGHEAAAGFALDMERFDAFRASIHAFAAAHPTPVPTVVADALLPLEAVDADLFAATHELEPYGEGHRAPAFLIRAPLAATRAVGAEGSHLQVRLGAFGARETKGIAFRLGALAEALTQGEPVDVVAELSENEWNGRTSIEFQARALRPAEALALGDELAQIDGGAGRVRRGPAAGGLPVRIDAGAPDPLAELRTAIASGDPVRVHLGPADEAAIASEAIAWPTVSDVRAAWVARARGQRSPLAPRLAARTDVVLRELGLLDEADRVVTGRKVEPYDSPTLRAGLVRRYLLQTLLEAYRQLDDAGFERVATLLAEPATD
jgi:single-stranded-DNA-specific exonuclease